MKKEDNIEFLQKKWLKVLLFVSLLIVMIGLSLLPNFSHQVWGQFPTVSMPTVTSSPRGVYVRAIGQPNEALNVRAYPSSTSTLLGRFQVGQEAKAYGYYGDYVLIEYIGAPDGKGWVWKAMVEIHGGELPMLEPPPTEVPMVTKTIDPTLAAQFIITQMPTRLPTFTEPPPLQIPTYQIVDGATATGGIPMGYIIVVLAGLGFFLALIAILRRG